MLSYPATAGICVAAGLIFVLCCHFDPVLVPKMAAERGMIAPERYVFTHGSKREKARLLCKDGVQNEMASFLRQENGPAGRIK